MSVQIYEINAKDIQGASQTYHLVYFETGILIPKNLAILLEKCLDDAVIVKLPNTESKSRTNNLMLSQIFFHTSLLCTRHFVSFDICTGAVHRS